MALLTINIPEELRLRLKEEENQSQLITRLLNDYYKYSDGDIEEKREQVKKLLEEKKRTVETYEKDIEKIEEVLKKKRDREE